MTKAARRPISEATPSTRSDLAAAVHATAWRLGERELRQLEALVAVQR